jgi:hypothetical protein
MPEHAVHFSAYPFKFSGQKVSGSHRELGCSKGVLYGTFSDEHTVRFSFKLCSHHFNTIGTLSSSNFSWGDIFSALRFHGILATNLNAARRED